MKNKDVLKLVALGAGALLLIVGAHDEYYTLKQDPNAASWSGTFQHNLGMTWELSPLWILIIGAVLLFVGAGDKWFSAFKDLTKALK
jgi:hypothetical protein